MPRKPLEAQDALQIHTGDRRQPLGKNAIAATPPLVGAGILGRRRPVVRIVQYSTHTCCFGVIVPDLHAYMSFLPDPTGEDSGRFVGSGREGPGVPVKGATQASQGSRVF